MAAFCCLAWLMGGATSAQGAGLVPWLPAAFLQEGESRMLRSEEGVAVVFGRQGEGWRWTAYQDTVAGREWPISGPLFSLQTADGKRANLGDAGFAALTEVSEGDGPSVVLETQLGEPGVSVRQTFSFCPDGRTLRIRSEVRATGEPLVIQRVGLLELRIAGQALKLMGPGVVSSPVFGDRIFAGIEYPAALCQVDGDALYLAQHSYVRVGAEGRSQPGMAAPRTEWVALPGAVFGSASEEDMTAPGEEGLRRAFLRYLDTVRVRATDMHIHYNNWWTMTLPSSEADVLANIAELRRGLYDRTGLFFDSYALDMGWSDPHTVWEVSREHYPRGFEGLREALGEMGSRPGLWVSPSSVYPPALDNAWLSEAGYEVIPRPNTVSAACLAIGGKYQRAFKAAALKHAREGNLAHMKFDGLAWPCDVAEHGHPTGVESYQPIAEGLMDVLDALREQNPNIALEPTCLGYYPSPWWLMHTPFVIGPFGDDSPHGRCPCPGWIESMTTGREIANLQGREAFLMPTSALECFDIIVQCPGDFENHAVMAIARGHRFLSCYINPKFMDAGEWQFFADLIRWARANREVLQEPLVIGGDPAKREAYGYAYSAPGRQLFFLRNPWIEETSLELPQEPNARAREVRCLYPRRAVLGRTAAGEPLPAIPLGPYELMVVEAVPTAEPPEAMPEQPAPEALWKPRGVVGFERVTYSETPAAYGPDWTSPDGDGPEALIFGGEGALQVEGEAELCLLVDGGPEAPAAHCSLTIDGEEVAPSVSRSAGSFSATGAKPVEEWVWFLTPVSPGEHQVSFRVTMDDTAAQCGVFVRGLVPSATRRGPFGPAPALPLYRPGERPWSRTLVPLQGPGDDVPARVTERRITRIDGTYLDTLEWEEATAGWGEVRRNRSVMGTPMMMAGRTFHRGIGTHAHSRITYHLPLGYRQFAATIGCDQEVRGNSIVFAVEGDGRELFRSPLMRYDSPLIDVNVPIEGVGGLALVLEDGGDGIPADHGDWADARLLR